jgi:hypothetical protein
MIELTIRITPRERELLRKLLQNEIVESRNSATRSDDAGWRELRHRYANELGDLSDKIVDAEAE